MIIKTINLTLPYGLGSVNCYLIKTSAGFVLIDTGCSNGRARLVENLECAGCLPGDLNLVLLTHGDFDHAGNAGFLRGKYKAAVAIHPRDSGMVEHGDTFYSRKKRGRVIGAIARFLFRFGQSARFRANLFVDEGSDLAEYGFAARVLHLPGHSGGSIGILTENGDLFCGDLIVNRDKPRLNSIIDNLEAANNSVRRIVKLGLKTVYPGHGKPFSFNITDRSELRLKMERAQPIINQYPAPR